MAILKKFFKWLYADSKRKDNTGRYSENIKYDNKVFELRYQLNIRENAENGTVADVFLEAWTENSVLWKKFFGKAAMPRKGNGEFSHLLLFKGKLYCGVSMVAYIIEVKTGNII